MSQTRILALVRHNVVLVGREPGPMISRIVMPLVVVTLLRPLYTAAQGRQVGTEQAISGTLVLFSLLGMSLVGAAMLNERLWHTFDRLRATPARPLELVVGKALPVLGQLLLQQGAMIGYGVAVLGLRPASPGLLVVAVLAWAMTLLGLGSAVGTLVRSGAELSVTIDIGSVLLTSFAGALVPLAELPGWAQAVARLSPGYWAMRAFTGALHGDAGSTLRAAVVLLGVAALAGAATTIRVTRGWGRSDLL
jgi:ABC-2 type transport system permease protein